MSSALTMNRLVLAWLMTVPAIVAADGIGDAKVLLKQRKYPEAIAQLTELAKTDTTGEAAFSLAVAFELKGEPSLAMEHYRAVVAGKGKRAAEAEKRLAALDSTEKAAAATAAQVAEIERAALEGSQKLKDARQRVLDSATKLAATERALRAKEIERDAAVASVKTAESETAGAMQLMTRWKVTALQSPPGRGRTRRVLGMLMFGIGAGNVAAATWLGLDAQRISDELHMETVTWTTEYDALVRRADRDEAAMGWTLGIGGGLVLAGSILLGSGEAALTGEQDEQALTRAVEGGR